MPIIPFSEYLPDQAAYGNPGVIEATNVFPSASGYLPVGSFRVQTNALDARPRGAILAPSDDGTVFQYAGDAAKLYQNVADVWTDRSKVGGYTTGDTERWEFTAWKNKVLGVNFSDDPQQITFGDAVFADLTTDFRARHITSIRDFVVVGNTFDGTDGLVPSRARWSAFNNENDWTVSPSTLADFQDLKTGAIQRVTGGEFGVILQRDSVWRMTFVGAPLAFQFDEVLPGIGAIAPGGVVRDGDTVYFLSDRGFFALVNGTQATAIGANKVDRTVLADLDESFLHRISAAIDVTTHRVLWAYPGAGNVDGRPNRIAVYDRSLDRWSLIAFDAELLWTSGGSATTLEGLDSISGSIDALPASLDAPRWKGSSLDLGVFNSLFESGFLDGPPMPAAITSKELEAHAGRMTRLNAFRPLVEGGSVTASVGTRDRQIDQVTFGLPLAQSASGRFTTRANARYHRFKFDLTGEWERAVGMQIEPREAVAGERRG